MKLFSGFSTGSMGWFRILGFGLTWKDMRKHNLMFSERYGFTKYIRVGNWVFKGLTPFR